MMLLVFSINKDIIDEFLFQETRHNFSSARNGASEPLQIAFHIQCDTKINSTPSVL